MLSRKDVGVVFLAQFTESKLGKTGLTVTADVWRITSAGSVTSIVTAGSAFAVGKGVYGYALASGTNTAAGLLVCVFSTATTTVDCREIPACWIVELPAPADVLAWNGSAPSNLSSGRVDVSVGAMGNDVITAASIAANAITSSEAPALAEIGSDTSGVTTLLSRLTSQRAANLDNLDATISSAAVVDWSSTEKNQIRFRLGLDGSQATPTSAPNLSTLTPTGVWSHATRTLTGEVSVDANSKVGVKLASDGLDAISADEPNGLATTFRGKLMQLWSRFFRRVERTSNQIITYRAGGTTPNTSQTWSESGSTENVSEAS